MEATQESLPLAASLRDSGWAFDAGICLVGVRHSSLFSWFLRALGVLRVLSFRCFVDFLRRVLLVLCWAHELLLMDA